MWGHRRLQRGVKAGVKRIALSHPTDTLAECQALIPFSEQICRQYGNHFYVEEEPLLTDLFPVSMNRGKFNHSLLTGTSGTSSSTSR